MKHYVVGFLFDGPFVLLLRKTHPKWQAGKLNGIGGNIEDNECAEEAMQREFSEEAGVNINRWKHYATLSGKEYRCHFFFAMIRKNEEPKSRTDEEIEWTDFHDLPDDIIPNLHWLIPLALDSQVDRPVEIFTT